MKILKLGLFITLTIIFSVLGGTVFGEDFGDASAYFPMKPGNYWIYKLSMPGSSQVFQQRVKVDEPENGKPKIIVYDPNGNPEVFVSYELNPQGLFKVSEMASWGLNEYHPLWPVLKNNMVVGTNWDWESDDHKMKESVKVVGMEKVTVPAGTYNALVVQCSGTSMDGADYSDKTWYVKNLGYVKDELTIKGKLLTSELTEYSVK
jgi:hypothetical protein